MATEALQIDTIPDFLRFKYDKTSHDMNVPHLSRDVARQNQRKEDVQLLKFPSTKNILWDHTETGVPQVLHVSYFRKPRLCVSEKVLRFAQRHVESSDRSSCSCVLVGSLNIDDDGEGVVFNVERLDPVGDTNTSTSHAAGDMLIPFTVQTGSGERGSTAEDYSNALQLLKQRCCSKDPVELGNVLLTKGWGSFYTTGETCVHHLEFEVVTVGTEIKAQPIGSVPIVPTALSKNLSGPMSISHMQGTPKTGYLTMDHTRKLLLVLESDPKVTNLPLVGIWVSGVSYAYSPYVWACCVRYLHNSHIQDRVCSPPDPFLLVLYNPTHSKPEFYECSTSSGSNKMTFDFYTGYEAVQISKSMMGNNEMVEIDLTLQRDGRKFELFQEAVLSSSDSGHDVSRRSMSPDPVSHDDITPRLKPAPHVSKLPMMQSMVPEVSLFFGNEDTTFVPSVQNPRTSQPRSLPIPRTSVAHQQPSSGQYQSVPNNTNISAQNRPVSEAVNNYVQNAHSVKISQSNNNNMNGLRSPNVQSQGNIDPAQPGATSPQSFPSTMPVFPHHVNTGQTSQAGYHPSSPAPTMGPQHNGYIPSTGTQVMGGPRPPYCSCPSCPKPPQFFSRPQSYESSRGPAPHRPVYTNYGPPPPRLNGPHSGYPPNLHQGGYPPSQGPSYPGHPYPQFSADQPQLSSGPYPVSQQMNVNPSNMNVYQQGLAQPMTSQGAQPNQITGQPYPSNITCQPYPSSSQNAHTQPGISNMLRTQSDLQASSGLPVQTDHKVTTPKTPAQTGQELVSRNSEVRRSNPSSDSSSRSSDDSGLSFTPEKHHSPSNQNSKSPVSSGDIATSLATVNWENVPPEIYQLLMQQDRQLKQLQAQIQILTVQQAQSLNNTADSAVNMKPGTAQSPSEKCTTGTNTSVGLGEQREQVSACMQTSQQEVETLTQNHDKSHRMGITRQLSSKDVSHSSSSGSGCETRTPADIRHRGRLPMNSTQRDEGELDMSQGELVALMNNMHDRTVDSVQSDMIVDLPSFQSSPTRSPRSQESCMDSTTFNMSPRSPISASMCEDRREDSGSEYSEDEEDNTAGTDNPEYYNRLMDNIKKLLSQNTTENTTGGELPDAGYSGDVSSDPSTPIKLARDEIKLGEHLQSFFRYEQSMLKAPTDTTFIPKINYVSMLLDSDTDTSMEINAMAMKYLKDEQLTQLTKLQAKNRLLQGSKKTAEKTALLQKILKMEDEGTPNVTTVGMSPNDLTFATKRYLERHGLLEGGTSSDSTQNDSYRLRINYSTVTSASEDGPAHITHEVLSTPENYRQRVSDTPTSVRHLDGIYSNGTTPTNNNSRTPLNDTKQSVGLNRTPKPNHVQSRLEDHRRLTPNSSNPQNSSVPTPHTASPFSHNSSPYTHDSSRQDLGANGRHVTPQITRPPQRPTHSPPERETVNNQPSQQDLRQENRVFANNRLDDYNRGAANFLQKQQFAGGRNDYVENYYDSRQHRSENVDDNRILDITHLKQLPKLL